MDLRICANCKNFWRNAADGSKGLCREPRNYLTSLGPKKTVKPLDSCLYHMPLNAFISVDAEPDMAKVLLLVQALHQTMHQVMDVCGDMAVLDVVLALANFQTIVVERFAANVTPEQADLLRRIVIDTLTARLIERKFNVNE